MLKLRSVLLNSKAAIDLASIMVGIIVIGLIGGVIAATVFAVIPWAQDNAAKQQLDSIHTAQNAAFGFSADPSRELPEGQERNSFTNSAGLAEQGLLLEGSSYCTAPTSEAKDDYVAYSKSGSGVIWVASNSKKTPERLTDDLIQDCGWLKDSTEKPTTPTVPEPGTEEGNETPTPGAGEQLYSDTRYLLNCNARATYVYLPLREGSGNIKIVNKATQQEIYNKPITLTKDSMQARVGIILEAKTDYEVVYDGTFASMGSIPGYRDCYREMISWRSDAGTTSADAAFFQMTNLTKVPTQIPSTVTSLSKAFSGTFFNASLASWDVSRVENMSYMFDGARFNQSLSNWNVSNVTDMSYMFNNNSAFNQSVASWNVGNVENMSYMFFNAVKFNSSLNDWNVSKVENMSYMFGATLVSTDGLTFNQPLDKWVTSSVTNMRYMFYNTRLFNQPLNSWDVSNVEDMAGMFHYAKVFNQPLNEWDTSSVTQMNRILQVNRAFVQDISMWEVGQVTNYQYATDNTNAKFTVAMRPQFGK